MIKIISMLSVVICYFISYIVMISPTLEPSTRLQKEHLAKEWHLEKYEVFGNFYTPKAIEKDDYISFYDGGTYSSISEGVYAEGTWSLDAKAKKITMKDKGYEGIVTFIVLDSNEDTLVLIIDDTDEPDAKYIKIHFKTYKE